MLEVDSLRRSYNLGHCDQSFVTMGPHNPFHGTLGPNPISDNHRVLIHWNQTEIPKQPGSLTDSTKSGSRSDEEDDDDEEERPFTPPPPRERLSYTRYQLELLNGIFNEVRYPNSTQKQLIAKRVGITREQVKIWFQNRRRKDVVGNSGKTKPCDTSTSSSGSHDSDRHQSPRSDDLDSSPSDDNMSLKRDSPEPAKEPEEAVVPPLVMKSIINELLKFINDPLKGRKNKKKAKAKQKEKAKLKKGITNTLLTGSYDMISPPNQIVPHVFFDIVKTGFNHSKSSSAFANPRDSKEPSQIGNTSKTSEISGINSAQSDRSNGSTGTAASYRNPTALPYPTEQVQGSSFPSPLVFHPQSGISGCEIPILSDLLAYRSPFDANRKKGPASQQPTHLTSSVPCPPPGSNLEQDKGLRATNNITSGRPLNGIFPFPFYAEQPMFMSSLRHPEHILRPSPHYPPTNYSDDPYQPLLISSFSNPYFSPTSTSWTGTGIQNTPTSVYTPL